MRKRWLAVHILGEGKEAVSVDEIYRMKEAHKGYAKYTEIELVGGRTIVVFGDIEEIVDKINE